MQKAGQQRPARVGKNRVASAFDEVDPLPVALDRAHPQPHLLAQLPADESTHAMSLPAGKRKKPGGRARPAKMKSRWFSL
jgi:hypothetical protein